MLALEVGASFLLIESRTGGQEAKLNGYVRLCFTAAQKRAH